MAFVDVHRKFELVKAYRSKSGICPACGQKTTRTRVFEHSINPFNRNLDGSTKSRDEVRAAVNAEADAWEPDFRHKREACAE